MEFIGQITTLVMIMVTGIILGLLFDCYRVLRGTCKPRAGMTWFMDLGYWLLATAIVFVSLVLSNWGELRFYVFIGMVSGLGLYYKWLSQSFTQFFLRGIVLVVTGFRLLKTSFNKIIVRPVVYCSQLVSWPVRFIWHKGISWCQNLWIKPPDDEKK